MPEALAVLEKLRADQHRLLLRAGWKKLDTEVVTMFLERHGWRG